MPLPIIRANLSSPPLPSGGGGPNLTGLLSTFLRGGSTTVVDPNKSRKLEAQAITAEMRNQPVTEQAANPQNLTAVQLKNLVGAQQATGDNTLTGGLSTEGFRLQKAEAGRQALAKEAIRIIDANKVAGNGPVAKAFGKLHTSQKNLLSQGFVEEAKSIKLKQVVISPGVTQYTLNDTLIPETKLFSQTKSQASAKTGLVKIGVLTNNISFLLNAVKNPKVAKVLSNKALSDTIIGSVENDGNNFIDATTKGLKALLVSATGGGDVLDKQTQTTVRKVFAILTNIAKNQITDKEVSTRAPLELYKALSKNIPRGGDPTETFRIKAKFLLSNIAPQFLTNLSEFNTGTTDIQPLLVGGELNEDFAKATLAGITRPEIKKQATSLVSEIKTLLRKPDSQAIQNDVVEMFRKRGQ